MVIKKEYKIIVAGLIFAACFFYIRRKPIPPPEVLIASQIIYRAHAIKDAVVWKVTTPEKVKPNSIVRNKVSEANLKEMMSLKRINQFQEITFDMVVDKRNPDYITKLLKKGYTIYAINFPNTLIKTQFIQVGCRVDLIIVYNKKDQDSEPLLRNAQVLGITDYGQNSDVLIGVHPTQIEFLIDARKSGSFFINLVTEIKDDEDGGDGDAISTVRVIRRAKHK